MGLPSGVSQKPLVLGVTKKYATGCLHASILNERLPEGKWGGADDESIFLAYEARGTLDAL